jgi:enamine deaminase RidA (YjgF/YER057c/UK114 family)
MSPHPGLTTRQRFTGALAAELALRCSPSDPTGSAISQAEAVYRDLVAQLAAEGAAPRHLVGETLFLRDIRRDLDPVLAARARVLGQDTGAPPPAAIGQTPLAPGATLELSATALIPHQPAGWTVQDLRADPACPCAGCARSAARLVRLGTRTALHTTNLYGRGENTYAQALDAFAASERLLAQAGMSFRDVVRTWIHLADIGHDYDALNQARREFFRRRDIEPRPASTGVQGQPAPAGHAVSLRLDAVRSAAPLARTPISTPTLNEAWSYGADFSRGLRVADGNAVALHVSGTASIDEDGRTVHVGDLSAQVDRMLHNIATLLAGQGASFADLISGIVYLTRPGDAPLLRTRCRERGFAGFPCVLVEAPLCRPDLLCEAEAVAMLPLPLPAA